MEFRLNETAPDKFEIVRFVPDLIGTFADRATAQKVLGFLEADAANAAQAAERKAARDAGLVSPPPIVSPETIAQAAEAIQPQTPAKSDVAHFSWSDGDLAEAYDRLAKGEKITAVADSFGKSWTVLRGKWAAHKKKLDAAKSPLEKLTGAVSELQDQTPCSLCGQHFTPTVASMDHCARCRTDA
jgi:hypothetical protein